MRVVIVVGGSANTWAVGSDGTGSVGHDAVVACVGVVVCIFFGESTLGREMTEGSKPLGATFDRGASRSACRSASVYCFRSRALTVWKQEAQIQFKPKTSK